MAGLAAQIEGAAEMDVDELARRGIDLILAQVRASLARLRVHMDRFSLEHELHDQVDEVLGRLDGVYESEGATWLRTTEYGDDKDRVLRRATGELTYFGPDTAYHADKRARGYDRVIDVWGADHHGYILRTRAAWQALGGDPDRLEIVIMQLVNLTEGGERVQMSKRAGTLVLLDDLLDDIGVDAARWFLVQRSHDTTIDLDLELARSQSQDNPVYYVQYAHARISGILAKAGEERVAAALAADLAGQRREPPSVGALAGQEAAGAAGRGARRRRAAGAAPDHGLRPRDRPGVLRLLPRREGGGGRGGGGRRGRAPGALRGHPAGAGPFARPARGRGAGGDVVPLRRHVALPGRRHGRLRAERRAVRVDLLAPARDPGTHRQRATASSGWRCSARCSGCSCPSWARARSWPAGAAGRWCWSGRSATRRR